MSILFAFGYFICVSRRYWYRLHPKENKEDDVEKQMSPRNSATAAPAPAAAAAAPAPEAPASKEPEAMEPVAMEPEAMAMEQPADDMMEMGME